MIDQAGDGAEPAADPAWVGPEDPETLAALRRERRLTLPPEDLWVFGYGSLMWKPGFAHLDARVARLHGYHRRYCVFSYWHRGTPDRPGLIFGLDRGGSCRGLAYRVPRAAAEATMEYLYDRELVTAVYRPIWVRLRTAEGPLRAATFVVDRGHEQYAGRLDEAAMVTYLLQGQGAGGSAREYLANTVARLEAMNLGDKGLRRLLQRVGL